MIEERVAITFMARSLCSFLLQVCIENPESLLSPVREARLSSPNTSGPTIANSLEDQPCKSQFVLISTFPLETTRNNDILSYFPIHFSRHMSPELPRLSHIRKGIPEKAKH